MTAHAGFTSVEFTLGASLLLVAIGVFASVQKAIMGLLTNTSAAGLIGEKALGVMEKASSELKWAEGSSLLITSENGASRLDLRVPTDCVSGSPVWSNTITYKVEPSTIDANRDGVLNEFRLVRLLSGTTRVLCENVVPGGFTAVRTGNNVALGLVLVTADAGRILKSNASTSVSLRN